MEGFDVNRFISTRTPSWRALEQLVLDMERRPGALALDDVRRFAKLYRAASSDLLLARTERVDASIEDYLNGLVARAYAIVYATQPRAQRRIWRFLVDAFNARKNNPGWNFELRQLDDGYNPLCGASPLAAKNALELGYRNVWLLPEGITGWRAGQMPIVSGANAK